jgi:hypothetical protein
MRVTITTFRTFQDFVPDLTTVSIYTIWVWKNRNYFPFFPLYSWNEVIVINFVWLKTNMYALLLCNYTNLMHHSVLQLSENHIKMKIKILAVTYQWQWQLYLLVAISMDSKWTDKILCCWEHRKVLYFQVWNPEVI